MTGFMTLIGVSELADLMERCSDDRLRVVDCRFDLFDADKGPKAYAEGHLPGAVFAHLDDDLAAPVTAETGRHPLPTPEQAAATFRRLGVSSATQVVAYDGGPGGLAARLWWMLRWLGHDKVAVLDGGYAAWVAAGQALSVDVAGPAPGDFEPRPRPDWVLTTAELADRVERRVPMTLVDAREAERFEGRSEPIDTAAGHVPGASNFPYVKNLRDDGRWRDAGELRALWDTHFGAEPPPGWAVMCGSGVTACHLALSAARAGLPPPRLYAGSWSEWIRNPARPRADGSRDAPGDV